MRLLPGLPRVLLITGTDTEVGKTMTTAALAAVLSAVGTVAVYKPVQTGVVGPEAGEDDGDAEGGDAAEDAAEAGDAAEVSRLSGVPHVFEGVRFREPMAPVAAAECEGRTLPGLVVHARQIEELSSNFDWVLTEGAGGVLVELDGAGQGLADLPALLSVPSAVIVVVRAGLGTLNHTALTVEALTSRGVDIAGLVVGSMMAEPGAVERSNLQVLAAGRVPFWGAIPAGAANVAPSAFRELAGSWLGAGVAAAEVAAASAQSRE